MPLFVSPCSHALWNIVNPVRNMMSWIISFSTLKQYAAPKGASSRPNCLALPFSESHRFTQANQSLISSFNGRPSTGYLQQIDVLQPTVSLEKKAPISCTQPRHLRILREQDLNVEPHCAGRMVISGRMNEVCAEIDRLVKVKE